MWMSVSCLRIKNNKYKCQSHGVTCDGSNTEGKEKPKCQNDSRLPIKSKAEVSLLFT